LRARRPASYAAPARFFTLSSRSSAVALPQASAAAVVWFVVGIVESSLLATFFRHAYDASAAAAMLPM